MNKKVFVQWGAGNIGRTLLCRIFGQAGYNLVCIDTRSDLVRQLNESGSYTIESVGRTKNKTCVVRHVSAIETTFQSRIDEVVTSAEYMGISVGKKAFETIIPSLSHAVMKRWLSRPEDPIDIIIAENIIDGAVLLRSLLKTQLPKSFPVDSYLGLVETSIGKMVPLQAPLSYLHLRCEPENELYVDRNGFLNPVPKSRNIHAVSPITPYIERKLFIQDLGLAATAYIGHYFRPESHYIDQVLLDARVFNKVKALMLQSMRILLSKYPDIFTEKDLTNYIDDLLLRFTNPSLKDTVYRVGKDLRRKLHYTERIMGAVIAAHSIGLCWYKIGEVFFYALNFHPQQSANSEDDLFLKNISKLPVREQILQCSCLDRSSLGQSSIMTILNALEIINEKFR